MKEKYDVKLEGKEWKDCLKHAFDKKKKDYKFLSITLKLLTALITAILPY